MTIFHVLRYPPEEIYKEWISGNETWETYLPEEMCLHLRNKWFAQPDISYSARFLRNFLLEYEGPIE